MSKSKATGTRFETEVVRALRDLGFPFAERRALAGTADRGDITGIPGVVLECKAVKQIDLAAFVDEAQREAINANAPVYAAVVKRRNHPTRHAYVVLPLEVFASIIK